MMKKIRAFFDKSSTSGHISNRTKLLLALPTMPSGLSVVLIHNAFIKFYTDIIGLDAKYVGIIYLIFGIWNAINDPLIGVYLDRMPFKPNRGKFAYMMKVTAPIVVIASLAMVFAQPGWNEWLIFAFLLVLLFIYDTCYTTFAISYASFILLAAPTKDERLDVSVITTYVGHIGGFLATLVPTLLLVGETNRSLTIIILSLILIVNALLYMFFLKPLKDHAAYYKDDTGNEQSELVKALMQNAKSLFKSRAFITYVLYEVVSGAKGIYFTPFLYMMDYVLKFNGLQATIVDVIPGLMIFVTIPFIGKYMKKIGLKRALILFTFPAAAGFAGLYFIQNMWQAILAYSVIAISLQAAMVAHPPMMGAIIDEDEQRTGLRKAGLFNGVNALLIIPVNGIHTAIYLAIISAFSFVSGGKEQSVRAITGIRFGASVIPFVFVLLGVIPIFFSPITLSKEKEISEFSKSIHKEEAEDGLG